MNYRTAWPFLRRIRLRSPLLISSRSTLPNMEPVRDVLSSGLEGGVSVEISREQGPMLMFNSDSRLLISQWKWKDGVFVWEPLADVPVDRHGSM